MEHVLAALAGSSLGRRLVLRGSVPLRAWLGRAAREPGDLDFVVSPPRVNRRRAAKLVTLARSVLARSPGAGLGPGRVVVADIWTYDRAFGRRLMVPFQAADLPPGTVQVDLVFNERLPVPPVWTTLSPSGTRVRTAPPELALAWKLLWLSTDTWPQAKDLYDATLLAEYVRAPTGLIRNVVGPDFTPEDVLAWNLGWDNLRAEHPELPDDAEQWPRRLTVALGSSTTPHRPAQSRSPERHVKPSQAHR